MAFFCNAAGIPLAAGGLLNPVIAAAAMADGANYRWDEEKDRSLADTVRIEVLAALVELAKL